MLNAGAGNVDTSPPPALQEVAYAMAHSEFLRAALEAASAAADVIRRYYQRNLKITIKADKSPVTEADVETEKIIRSIVSARFPDHGFYGEETGTSAMDADYVWIVDPIDGTKAFIREYPMFSTQIALMHRGRLIVGVSSAPAYGELAYGEIGVGAWLNDAPIAVSRIDALESATLSTGNLKTLATGPRWPMRCGARARSRPGWSGRMSGSQAFVPSSTSAIPLAMRLRRALVLASGCMAKRWAVAW